MKSVIIALCIFLFSLNAFAENVDGYYINKTADTVKGKLDIPIKSKVVKFDKLTFDFKFSSGDGKFKKIDRLDVKGFGFVYEGKSYDFVTWDVKANQQIYYISALGDVAPDGVYFILRTGEKYYPIYSLFQLVEENIRVLKDPVRESSVGGSYRNEFNGNRVKRDVIIKHPTKGFLLIYGGLPRMKLPELFTFLGMEEAFTNTLSKKDKDLLEIIGKYNEWKAKQTSTESKKN